jgi:hypothetical protein
MTQEAVKALSDAAVIEYPTSGAQSAPMPEERLRHSYSFLT